MAISAVFGRGLAFERVSDTTLTISPSSAITVGKIACITVAADNIATTDGASTDHSVSDTDGHTWTKIFEETESSGAATDGVTVSLWMTKVTSEIGTGDVVTITFGSAILCKVAHIWEFTVDSGNTFALQAVVHGHNDTGAGTETSGALSGMPSREYLFCGTLGAENETVSIIEDADYTEVNSEARSSTTGAADTNITLHSGVRIATLTGDTYTLTGCGPNGNLTSLAAVYEVAEVASTADPYPYIGGGYYPVEG